MAPRKNGLALHGTQGVNRWTAGGLHFASEIRMTESSKSFRGRNRPQIGTSHEDYYMFVSAKFSNCRLHGLILLLFGVYICIMIIPHLNRPHSIYWSNLDETSIAALSVEWASSGHYRATILPDGLLLSENVFAANTAIYPYISGVLLKIFGVQRWCIRFGSIVSFFGAATCLYFIWRQTERSKLKLWAVFICYFGCPFLLQSSTVGRPEMLSVFLCYFAAFLAVKASTSTEYHAACIFFSGSAAALAVWNNPLFAGLSCLSPLLYLEFCKSSLWRKGLIYFLLGAMLAVIVMSLVILVPHWDAWKEQWPLNKLTYTKRSPEVKLTIAGILGCIVAMKSRFSMLGMPYLSWYLLLPVWCCLFRSASRKGLFAVSVIMVFQIAVALRTPILFYTVIQFVAALPLMLFFVNERPLPVLTRAKPVLILLFSISCCIHPWLIFRETESVRAYEAREIQIAQRLIEFPKEKRIVMGPVQAAFPSWKLGFRYIGLKPVFFEEANEIAEKYSILATTQADLIISDNP